MSSDEGGVPTSIKTPKETLKIGLKLVHFLEGRIDRADIQSNITQFQKHYWCDPSVAATIFEDLQVTNYPIAHLGKK